MTIIFDDKPIRRTVTQQNVYTYRLVFADGRDTRQRASKLEVASVGHIAEQVSDERSLGDRVMKRLSQREHFNREVKALCEEHGVEVESAGIFIIRTKEGTLKADEQIDEFTQALDKLAGEYGIGESYIVEPIDYPV